MAYLSPDFSECLLWGRGMDGVITGSEGKDRGSDWPRRGNVQEVIGKNAEPIKREEDLAKEIAEFGRKRPRENGEGR